jgi:hypothetical protein
LTQELWIWRPILANKVTVTEVKNGTVTVEDLQRINAIMDMQKDIEAAQYAKANKK